LRHCAGRLSKGGSGIFRKGAKNLPVPPQAALLTDAPHNGFGELQAGTKEQALQPNQGTDEGKRKGSSQNLPERAR
jgi:hypothetical protein